MGVPVLTARSAVAWDRNLKAPTAAGIPTRSWRRFGDTKILGDLDMA